MSKLLEKNNVELELIARSKYDVDITTIEDGYMYKTFCLYNSFVSNVVLVVENAIEDELTNIEIHCTYNGMIMNKIKSFAHLTMVTKLVGREITKDDITIHSTEEMKMEIIAFHYNLILF